MQPKSEFFKCDCSCHALEIQKDPELGVLLSIWYLGRHDRLTFTERLKWAWRLLVRGELHADTVILEQNELEKLKNYVSKL
jgi:hypothetical protein